MKSKVTIKAKMNALQNGAQEATDGTSSLPKLLLKEFGHLHPVLWTSETNTWTDQMTRDLDTCLYLAPVLRTFY